MNAALDKAIRDAMLAWLLALPADERGWTADDPPVETTGWDETPYLPSGCSTCGDDWPTVTVHYRTRSGREDFETVDEDFGEFIRRLT